MRERGTVAARRGSGEAILDIGCAGCTIGVVIALVFGIPIAIWVATISGRQKRKLYEVNLDKLSDGERTRWEAYGRELEKSHVLNAEQIRQIEEWLIR